MKRILFILGLFFVSCNDLETSQEIIDGVDSVLIRSEQSLMTSDSIHKKSDSTTKDAVVKVIKDFKYLKTEIEKYKTERIQLMSIQNLSTEKIVYRIDTVYIETKKNFWGKEKTSTSVKSDSSTTTLIDTTINLSEKIDTLNLN
jgi:hypothetical protein